MVDDENGKDRLAGKAARNCANGWIFSASAGLKPIITPSGTQISGRDGDQNTTRIKRVEPQQKTFPTSDQMHFRPDERRQPATPHRARAGVTSTYQTDVEDRQTRGSCRRDLADLACRREQPHAQHGSRGKLSDGTPMAGSGARGAGGGETRIPERRLAACLLEAELVRPGDQRPEHQLIVEQDDDRSWRG